MPGINPIDENSQVVKDYKTDIAIYDADINRRLHEGKPVGTMIEHRNHVASKLNDITGWETRPLKTYGDYKIRSNYRCVA